jgi:phosphoribosylformimino-5-aminoimidazole carboxamide ribotide isomerase
LGPGNDEAAREALKAWPGVQALSIFRTWAKFCIVGGLQIGGGIDVENARKWIDAGASKVTCVSHFHFQVFFISHLILRRLL